MSGIITIRDSVTPEVPSALLTDLNRGPPSITEYIFLAMKRPLVTIADPTAQKAKTNLQRSRPFSGPFSLSTENGPTWRNLVMPKEPVIIEMKYVVKNQVAPPKPVKTAHLLSSG